jgi:hypothetical protein
LVVAAAAASAGALSAAASASRSTARGVPSGLNKRRSVTLKCGFSSLISSLKSQSGGLQTVPHTRR